MTLTPPEDQELRRLLAEAVEVSRLMVLGHQCVDPIGFARCLLRMVELTRKGLPDSNYHFWVPEG